MRFIKKIKIRNLKNFNELIQNNHKIGIFDQFWKFFNFKESRKLRN